MIAILKYLRLEQLAGLQQQLTMSTKDFNEALTKAHDRGYQQGRKDAVDELLDHISESIIWDVLAEVMKRNIGASDGADKIIDYLREVAEQVKGGEE